MSLARYSLSQRTQKIVAPISVVVLMVIVGGIIVLRSHASTPIVSVEAESGTVGGNAQALTDMSASAGGAVLFQDNEQSLSFENPTPGAVSVRDSKYGLTGNAANDADATDAFAAAMTDAIARTSVRYADGPGGAAQAVVYVPPGTYRLNGLDMISNIRLEISADAVLEPIVMPNPYPLHAPTSLIDMGSDSPADQVVNVSLVGVGTAANTALKQRANPVAAGWDISHSFTTDLKPADSGGANDLALAVLINVKGFLIKNLYIIQDDTLPSCTNTDSNCNVVGRGPYPMPTTARAALVYRPSNQDGRAPNGPFYDPTNGSVINMYTIHSPYGFGPTQITAGHNVIFKDLYSEGGTTLRMETDASLDKNFDGELKGVTANNIVGINCNRAVSLTSHKQLNGDVHLTNVKAISCQNGIVQESEDTRNSGVFTDSTVDHMTVVSGNKAQLPVQNTGGKWTIGQSDSAINVHPAGISWSANYTNLVCTGPFTSQSGLVILNGVPNVRPNCL